MTNLTKTRPEKAAGCEQSAYAVRNVLARSAQEHGLNLAETISVSAHAFASLLAGAYPDNAKSQEAVLHALPDVIRAYIPQWERIYDEFDKNSGRAALSEEH